MIVLPYGTYLWPNVRILTADSFAGEWTVQPMWRNGRFGFGMELLRVQRVAMPAVGEATFRFRFGVIDGQVVGSDTPEAPRAPGSPWNPESDFAGAPNLEGKQVRIQVAPITDAGQTEFAWRTVFWGLVRTQVDTVWPAAGYPVGQREYMCVDGLFMAKQWLMTKHTLRIDETDWPTLSGHPGYNVGNIYKSIAPENKGVWLIKSDSDNLAFRHTDWLSVDYGEKWTDREAINHALRASRALGDPQISVYDPAGLMLTNNAWHVHDSMTAWDFVAQVCRRARGRGLAFIDWEDDLETSTGLLVPRLSIYPMTVDNVTVNLPVAGTKNYIVAYGATTTSPTTLYDNGDGAAVVDLIGDHRIVAEDFKLSERSANVADMVESVGERIQVCFTGSFYDTPASLGKNWSDAYEATFAALDAEERSNTYFDVMWSGMSLRYDWNGTASNHNGGPPSLCFRLCNDDGSLTAVERGIDHMECRIMADTPLLAGYTYTGASPARVDGGAESFEPTRLPPTLYVRVADDQYLRDIELDVPQEIRVNEHGLEIFDSASRSSGDRYIADSADLAPGYAWNTVGMTLAIELPNRVRMATTRTVDGTAEGVKVTVRRTVRTNHNDLHLWQVHGSAIWSIDGANEGASGFPGLRNCLGKLTDQVALVRDDRDTLAKMHALACVWYLQPRRTVSWALRACGMLPEFYSMDVDLDGTLGDPSSFDTIPYPKLGQMIAIVQASGQRWDINTPVTMITYDHQEGVTTWETDWQELDFA